VVEPGEPLGEPVSRPNAGDLTAMPGDGGVVGGGFETVVTDLLNHRVRS
jgi:hypothetical protein